LEIITDSDFIGIASDHPLSKTFKVLVYKNGGYSVIPNNFFRNWLDEDATSLNSKFAIGKCSGFGVGSLVKYDAGHQILRVGRFVSGGLRLKFLLNGQHDIRTISSYMFSTIGVGLKNMPPPQYSDSFIGNDVWLGDEMMMLGGGIISDGCVIGARSLLPPNFRSEEFGIYGGVPAKLIRFRFSEKIREKLIELSWWAMPLAWVKENNDFFLIDLTIDEGRSLEILDELLLRQKK